MLLTIGAQAQDLTILVNKKGKVGFADRNGNEVIKCEYENAQPFVDGVAIVTKSGKSGIIDATGTVLLPLKYKQITPWTDELYIISTGKKYGLATHRGEIVLPVKYSNISKPNCYGKAMITFGGSHTTTDDNKTYLSGAYRGIINAKGEILIPAKYNGLYEFGDVSGTEFPYYEGKRIMYRKHCTTDTLMSDCKLMGYSINYLTAKNSGIIDERGNILLKNRVYDYVMYPQSGMIRYYNAKGKNTICGYHNLENGNNMEVATFTGKPEEIKFWTHGDFIGNIAPVNGETWSFIDKEGKTLRSGYSSLKHDINTGLWAARNASGQWDVFDDNNQNVDALCGFAEIIFPANKCGTDLFVVCKDGKYGCITRDGSIVIPMEYEAMTANTYDVVGVKKNGKWGLLKEDNTTIIPEEYINLIMPEEENAQHLWVQKEDSLYYHDNIASNDIATIGYKWVTNFKHGIALVAPQELTVEDTQTNRAQIFASQDKTFQLDMSQMVNHFGYLMNTDNTILAELPIYILVKDAIIKEITKRGGRALTKSETKKILQDITAKYRSYDLDSTLDNNEWDY